MAKQFKYFGSGDTDKAVMKWMTARNIDPGQVMGYCIERNAEGKSVLTLELHFDDEIPTAPVTDPADLPQAFDPEKCGTFPREMFNDSNSRKD